MYCRYRQQAWNCYMCLVDIPVREDDIVVSFLDAALGILAEFIQGITQVAGKGHRQLYGIEPFVTDIAEDVQLGVVQYRMGQPHHLAVAFVWIKDTCSDPSDILFKTHYQALAD